MSAADASATVPPSAKAAWGGERVKGYADQRPQADAECDAKGVDAEVGGALVGRSLLVDERFHWDQAQRRGGAGEQTQSEPDG